MLKVGDTAPAFSSLDHRGQPIVLAEKVASGPVVVYFYPRAFAIGCTQQACNFRDAYLEFKALGAEIIGVSFDDTNTHRRFATEFSVPFPLISDPTQELGDKYGVTHFMRLFPKRMTYVIGPDMKIRGIFHHELNLQRHVTNVRAVLEQMFEERRLAEASPKR